MWNTWSHRKSVALPDPENGSVEGEGSDDDIEINLLDPLKLSMCQDIHDDG